MGVIIPPGFAQMSYFMSLAGDPEVMVTTMGLDLDAPPTVAMVAALVNQFSGRWDDHSSSSLTFSGGRLTYGVDGGDPLVIEVSDTDPGLLGTTFLPNNCAYLVRKHSALGGRKHRGRCYLPFASEGNVDMTGAITPAALATLNTAAAGWLSDINATADVNQAVILHSGPEVPTPIVALTFHPRIATQRRRMRP